MLMMAEHDDHRDERPQCDHRIYATKRHLADGSDDRGAYRVRGQDEMPGQEQCGPQSYQPDGSHDFSIQT